MPLQKHRSEYRYHHAVSDKPGEDDQIDRKKACETHRDEINATSSFILRDWRLGEKNTRVTLCSMNS